MENRVKPGHLFHLCRVWGSRHGGSIYSQVLVDELAGRGWKVTVVAESFEQRVDDGMRLDAFFQRGTFFWPRKLWETVKLLNRILRAPGALIIVQGDLPRLTYLLLQVLRPLIFIRQDGLLMCPANNRFLARSRRVCPSRAGARCLATHRRESCFGQLSLPEQLGRVLFRARDRMLLTCLRNFVTNSQYIARGHGRPATVLYPPRLTQGAERAAIQRDLSRLVFCGRLEEVKGAAEAVAILSLLPERYHLEILGDGPERGRLGKAVEDLQLGHRVSFHGWTDPIARDLWFASAGVLVMPSLWDEAFGMVGIEALAQGTPVVAYDVGGISEWCRGGAGVLIGCGDFRSAVAAVRQLTDDPRRWAAHSQAARRVAEREFPVGRFGRDLDALLAQTVRSFG